jgi:hypothetical protein
MFVNLELFKVEVTLQLNFTLQLQEGRWFQQKHISWSNSIAVCQLNFKSNS